MSTAWHTGAEECLEPEGEFVDFDDQRHYAIRDVDRMPPFRFAEPVTYDSFMLRGPSRLVIERADRVG